MAGKHRLRRTLDTSKDKPILMESYVLHPGRGHVFGRDENGNRAIMHSDDITVCIDMSKARVWFMTTGSVAVIFWLSIGDFRKALRPKYGHR